MRLLPCALATALVCSLIAATSWPKGAAPPRKATVLNTVFEVDPTFEKAVAEQIERARKEIRSQREQGKLIAYISTPISSRGGGYEPTNLAISAFIKKRLEERHGKGLWALDPGQFQLPKVDGREARGGEYLYMWTEILAGVDGLGRDFDMIYFTGPTDVHAFFGSTERGILDAIERYIETEAKQNEGFRKEVASNPERRRAFIRFYGLRASVAYSKGAHDEWNIFVKINRKRGVGDQVAMFFDGRALSPAEMETEIAAGYELR